METKEYIVARITIYQRDGNTRKMDVSVEEHDDCDVITDINMFCKGGWRLIQIIQEDPIREPKKLVGIFERDYIPFEEREIEDEEN